MRVHFLEKTFFFLLAFIVAALFTMQIIKGDFYHEQSRNNRIRVVALDAPRGKIIDRNGVILADNRSTFNVTVVPQDVEDAPVLFAFVGEVLKKDPQALSRLFKYRKITPFDPVVIAEDVDRNALIRIEENRFLYPGLGVQEAFKRLYPFHESSAHAVGYVGKIDPTAADVMSDYGYTVQSFVGKSGIEHSYEYYLQGEQGGRQIEVNSRGQQVRLLGTKESRAGKDIALTIDQRIQTTAFNALANRRGSVVVMNMDTGQVLGLVSSPSFDPDAFTTRVQRYRIPGYFRDPFKPLLNRATGAQFPPGSVFKVPVALAALQRQKITENSHFDCPGYYMVGQRRFGCAHVHGPQNLKQALAHSCNVFFFRIGQLVTPSVIGAYAKAFGLTRPTGIDLPFEVSGKMLLPGQRKDGWFTGNTLNLSIGQGDTLTSPMQLLVMMAAVANEGVLMHPRLIAAIDGRMIKDPDKTKLPTVRLDKHTWQLVQEGLRQTVEDEEGTAHLLNDLDQIKIYGKTGTAQAGKQGDHSWFVGYLKSPKNNLVFSVFLEHGGPSSNAVAIAHDLLHQIKNFGII